MKNFLAFIIVIIVFSKICNAQIPFTPIDTNFGAKTIMLPKGYGYSTLLIGGVDSVTLANGTKQLSKESQDLIVYIPKNGSSSEGTLYVGHETSGSDAARGNGGAATIFDIKRGPYEWQVVGNRRKVDFTVVGGTSNNCAGNLAPKGTVFSAEESAPANNPGLSWGSDTADFGGYKRYLNNGYMVEVDAVNNKVLQKCYAMGRFAHEGCAFMPDHKTAYLTEDATPAVLFKFVADNFDDYTSGQLYAYKQSADGLSGSWLPIPRQRDSINITKAIALRLGATMFLRLEDCEVGPDGNIYIAETGTDNANLTANELAGNKIALHLEPFRKPATSNILDTFGRIVKLDPISGKVTNFLQGGRGSDGITCVSNPDNIAFDFKRNLMTFHEDINGTTGGRSLRNLTTCENYYVDMSIPNPTVNDAKRFMVCPTGGEATGIWFTPDYETYFVNVQHPSSSDFFPFSKATTLAINKSPIKASSFDIKFPPFLGTTGAGTTPGIPIFFGALSGLDAIPGDPNGFMSLTDRGPNVDADNINGGNAAGLFPLPGFNPAMYELRTEADSIRIMRIIPLKNSTGGAVSGLPLPAAPGNTPDVFFLDTSKTPAPTNLYGIDCEGIVPGLNNDYIISDEYGPCLWSVDKLTGTLKWRYTPYPIAGPEILFDSIYKKRRSNRGFEGVAFTPRGRIIAILQSPAYNPSATAGDASQIHRILEIDQATGKTRTFAYLHQPKTANLREKDWKIGDIAAINDYEFLIIEHALRNGEDSKKIYKFDIRNATPITTDNFGGKTLEQLVDAKGLASFGIKPAEKILVMDLLANGWDPKLEKPEGLAIINDSTIAICNDNDFGIISPNVDGLIVQTGVPSRLYKYTLTPEQKLQNYIRIDKRVNPRLAVNPKILKIDSVDIGKTSCVSFTVSNPGADPVKITKQYFSSNDGDFSFLPIAGKDTLLAPGASRTIQVCFTPRQRGSRQARITFRTDLPLTYETPRQDTSLISIDIVGTGTPIGKILTYATHRTDSSFVGTEVCHVDTLYNIGDETVTINKINYTGINAQQFKITGLTLPLTIPSKAKVVYTVCGTPLLKGMQTAAVNLEGITSGKVLTTQIPLGVYGYNTCMAATPTAPFREKRISVNSSDTQKITITNCGEIPTAYSIAISGDVSQSYSIAGNSTSAVVGQNGTASFFIVFSPTVKDLVSAKAEITGFGVAPITILLDGAGSLLKVTSLSPMVPTTPVGKTSSEFELLLTNEGNVEWLPGTPTITGPFVYRSGANAAIEPGSQGIIKLAFSPINEGPGTGSVIFDHSMPSMKPDLKIDLSGNGITEANVALDENGEALVQLDNNFPNPFSGITTFNFHLGKPSFAEWMIYSPEGRIVSQAAKSYYSAGTYSLLVDASGISSGTYIFTLRTSFGSISKNMTIIK